MRKTYCVDCCTYIDSVPRQIVNTLEAARSASPKRVEELASRVQKVATITKRQLDLATRLMLEHVSPLSDADFVQSAMVQLFLDCADRATEPSTDFIPFRDRPMDFDDNQALSLRVVDPFADDGVWAIIDEECSSCCHGEV